MDQAERDEMYCLKMMAGELRWIQQKDRAIELLLLAEARRMEDLYFQTRSPSTRRNTTDLMDSKEDNDLYMAMEMVEEVPPFLRKRKLNGRPKYKIKGCCLPPGTGLTSNLDERKYRVGLRRLRKMRENETQPNPAGVSGLVNVEKEVPLVMHTGQTKGTILPYLSNKCAIGMKMTKEPERDAKNADRDER